MWSRVSLSDACGVFMDELTLSTGPLFARPPTGKHPCERLLDDADEHWDLGPVWPLDGDW